MDCWFCGLARDAGRHGSGGSNHLYIPRAIALGRVVSIDRRKPLPAGYIRDAVIAMRADLAAAA